MFIFTISCLGKQQYDWSADFCLIMHRIQGTWNEKVDLIFIYIFFEKMIAGKGDLGLACRITVRGEGKECRSMITRKDFIQHILVFYKSCFINWLSYKRELFFLFYFLLREKRGGVVETGFQDKREFYK